MIVKKFVKIDKPHKVEISHGDQKDDGLVFDIIYDGEKDVVVLIKGEDKVITEYIHRYEGNAVIVDDEEMGKLYDTKYPVKECVCIMCNGTGNVTIPDFELETILTNIDKKDPKTGEL